MAARVGTKAKALEPTTAFVQRTSNVKRVYAVLFSVQNQLAKLPTASTVINIGNGLTFSRRDITRLRSEGNKLLDTNNSEYKHAHAFAKKVFDRKARAPRAAPFNKPVGIKNNAKSFFESVIADDDITQHAVLESLGYKFWQNDEPVTSVHLNRLFNNYISVEMLGTLQDGRIIEIDDDDNFAVNFKEEIDNTLIMNAALREQLEIAIKEANSSDLTGKTLEYNSAKGVPTSKPLKNSSTQIFAYLAAAKPRSLDSDARGLGYDNAAEAIKSSTKKAKLKSRVVPKMESNLGTYFSGGDYRNYAQSKYFSQYTQGRGDEPGVYTIALFDLNSIIAQLTTPYDGVIERLDDMNQDIDLLHKYSEAKKEFEKKNERVLDKDKLREGKVLAGLSAIGINLRP
uniref:Uncharacterized protein n=1 Tax=Pithovirus LCPAC406 TaxID=2506599 RepID=A0A481ZDP2_9VIRU|nr:MAG: hypothetical protein LCPAC406_00900 [Pithovirus LCPAC406]